MRADTASDPILALDTGMGACSAALAVEGAIAAARFETCRTGHSERLIGMAEEVLAEAGLGFADMARFAVTIGPGSFTGVRIGLAAARAFALTADKPLVGITTLEAVGAAIASARDLRPGTPLRVVMDARRGEVYWQDFEIQSEWWNLSSRSHPEVAPPETLPAAAPDTVLAGTGVALLPGATASGGENALPDAAVVALLAARRPVPEPYAPPQPLYLRAPDAKLPGGKTAP